MSDISYWCCSSSTDEFHSWLPIHADCTKLQPYQLHVLQVVTTSLFYMTSTLLHSFPPQLFIKCFYALASLLRSCKMVTTGVDTALDWSSKHLASVASDVLLIRFAAFPTFKDYIALLALPTTTNCNTMMLYFRYTTAIMIETRFELFCLACMWLTHLVQQCLHNFYKELDVLIPKQKIFLL